METDPAAKFWRTRARELARRVNAGWWLQAFAPAAVAVMTVATLGVWLARHLGHDASATPVAVAAAAALGAAGAFAYLKVKRRFWGEAEGMVQIEEQLGLRSALTAAAGGKCEWPAAPEQGKHATRSAVPRWKPTWLALPVAAATYFALATWLIPVSASGGEATVRTTPPQAHEEIARLLEALEEEAVVEPEALEEFAKRLEALREQPGEAWYSHAGMEAADTERTRLEHAIEEMAASADKAGFAATALERLADELTPAEREALFKEASEGLKGLETGDLRASEKALGEFSKIDPSKLRTLTKEQLAKMREQMAKTASACKQCQG